MVIIRVCRRAGALSFPQRQRQKPTFLWRIKQKYPLFGGMLRAWKSIILGNFWCRTVQSLFARLRHVILISQTDLPFGKIDCQFSNRRTRVDPYQRFSGTFIPDDGVKRPRDRIPLDVLQRVQLDCQNLDHEARRLISLRSDTVMRLSEACGLLVSDIHFDTATPFIDLVEHPWRRLKTASSQRQIPLVGFSLWTSRKIVSYHSRFVFQDTAMRLNVT